MDAAGYVILSRQTGLMNQMTSIANNVANVETDGFRREGMVFSEYIRSAGQGPSVSMGHGNARVVDLSQGGHSKTGGAFDLAIEGEGFFLIATTAGNQLTRAGAFTPGPDGTLLTNDGYPVLDEGGSTIFVPPDARNIVIGRDGTISADGNPLGRIGLWKPSDPLTLKHELGTRFSADAVEPHEGGAMLQGFLEGSNVDPLREIATMIAVQRAYELGQSFLEGEGERVRTTIQTLGR